MKDNEKKANATEEVKEEVKAEDKGTELTDEELTSVNAGGTPPFSRSVHLGIDVNF